MSISEDKISKYYEWYEKSYYKIANIGTLKEKYKENKDVINLIDKIYYKLSVITRYDNLLYLKTILSTKKTEYIITLFKAKKTINKIEYFTNYSILYSYKDKNNFTHDYVSTATPFLSADGEYRNRLVPIGQTMKIVNDNKQLFNEMEEYLIKKINKNKIHISHISYYNNEEFPKINTSIEKNNFAVSFYNMMWLTEIYKIFNNYVENHSSKKAAAMGFQTQRLKLDPYFMMTYKYNSNNHFKEKV